jgi:hypothetical protein
MTPTDWIVIVGLIALGSKNVRGLILIGLILLAISSLFGMLN